MCSDFHPFQGRFRPSPKAGAVCYRPPMPLSSGGSATVPACAAERGVFNRISTLVFGERKRPSGCCPPINGPL